MSIRGFMALGGMAGMVIGAAITHNWEQANWMLATVFVIMGLAPNEDRSK